MSDSYHVHNNMPCKIDRPIVLYGSVLSWMSESALLLWCDYYQYHDRDSVPVSERSGGRMVNTVGKCGPSLGIDCSAVSMDTMSA